MSDEALLASRPEEMVLIIDQSVVDIGRRYLMIQQS
jgi:hypothetical protein